MKFIDVHEASVQWDMTERRITMLCRDGKIDGAKKEGKLWWKEIEEAVNNYEYSLILKLVDQYADR